MRVISAGTVTRAVLLCAVTLFACSKDKPAGEPGNAGQNRDNAAKLTAPPLFAHIPADTAGVFASFEPIPAAYWDRVARDLGPEMGKVVDQVLASPPGTTGDPAERFGRALLTELRANWSQEGFKKVLGLSREARFAIYAIGIVPVLRLELADEKALLATVEKHAASAGLTLPVAMSGGRSYWRFQDGDVLIVLAVADGQLIAAGGPTPLVEQGLPFILGTEKPKPNMADGEALKKLAADHGFSGAGLGYVDANNVLKLLAMVDMLGGATGSPAMSPACKTEISALARRFPRLAFGYDEISDKRFSARLILETEPALAARLRELVTEVPGFSGGKLADKPLLAFGLGVNIDKARALALDFSDAIGQIGTSCGKTDMVEDAAEMRGKLSQPLPPAIGNVKGLLVSVLGGDLGPDGKPQNIEAFAVLASDDPKALLDLAQKEIPAGQVPPVAPDGQYHDVVPAGAIPGLSAIRAAVKPKALVAAVGENATAAADRALAQTGEAPLLYIAYNYGQIAQKMMRAMPPGAAGPMEGTFAKVTSMFGLTAMWVYPSEKGLAFAMSMEMN